MGIGCFIILPLSMYNKMGEFQYASLIVLIAITYIFIMLLIELPSYYEQNSDLALIQAWNFDLNFVNSCSMSFFAFTNHVEYINI
jgi:amino acid permease